MRPGSRERSLRFPWPRKGDSPNLVEAAVAGALGLAGLAAVAPRLLPAAAGLLIALALLVRRSVQRPAVRGRVLEVRSRRNAVFDRGTPHEWPGLFSDFHHVLGAVRYGIEHGAVAVHVVLESTPYRDPARGPNWWAYFFEPFVPLGPAPARETPMDRIAARYRRALSHLGLEHGFGDVIYGEDARRYPASHALPRSEVHRLIHDHLKVLPGVRAKAEGFRRERFAGHDFVLGVHYRGTDTARHFPYRKLRPETYDAWIARVLERRAPRDYAIFAATDESDFLERLRQRHGDRVLCYHESPRAADSEIGVHHAGDPGTSAYRRGESVVIDALLLSECDHLIKGRSNVSDAALVFNPLLPVTFLVTEDEVWAADGDTWSRVV